VLEFWHYTAVLLSCDEFTSDLARIKRGYELLDVDHKYSISMYLELTKYDRFELSLLFILYHTTYWRN